MSTTPTHGGLFGLLKRTGAIFQNPAQTIVAMAMIAAVLTIATHAGVPIPYAAAFIAIILGLACLFAEAFTAKGVVDAFWYGRPLGAVGYTMLWCAAFGYAMMNWLGTASETQVEKSNVHKAAHFASVDTRKAVDEAEKIVARLESERSMMKPTRSQPEARAAMDSAKAKWQWDASSQCTKTVKNTRKFCDAYRAAEADLTLWDQISVQEGKLENAKARLDEARAVASNTKMESTDDRGDLLILASFFDVPASVAQNIVSIWQTAVLSLLISLTTILQRLEDLRQKGGRVRMNLGFKIKRFLARTFLGREPLGVKYEVHNHGTMDGISVGVLEKVMHRNGMVPA